MSRLPPPPVDALGPDALATYQAILASRGAVRGPLAVLLHDARVADPVERLGGYLRFGTTLPDAVREAAVTATVAALECPYELETHRELAALAGVDPSLLDEVVDGGRPVWTGDADGEVRLAAEVARQLGRTHRVAAPVYAAAERTWSAQELTDLVALVGYFAFIAAVVNAFEVEPG